MAFVLRGDELTVVPDRLPAAGVVDCDGEEGVAVLLHDHADRLVGADIRGSGHAGAWIDRRARGGAGIAGLGSFCLGDKSAGISLEKLMGSDPIKLTEKTDIRDSDEKV